MGKFMSIELQNRLKYIPILNMAVVFMCFYNIIVFSKPKQLFLKFVSAFLVAFIVSSIVVMVFKEIIPNVWLSKFLELYFIPLYIDLNLIDFQKKNFEEKTGDGSE